jgi:hypothetical protein
MHAMYNGTKVLSVSLLAIVRSDTVKCVAENFDSLADLIASYPIITRNTHFVLVPGPLDITGNSILPRRPLLSSFVSRMRNKVPKVRFATNPCRIKFFGQEIVIFREDTMARMLRNTIRVKQEAEGEDLRRFVRHACRGYFIALTGNAVSIVDSGSEPSHTLDVEHTTDSVRLRSFPPLIPIADGGASHLLESLIVTLMPLCRWSLQTNTKNIR